MPVTLSSFPSVERDSEVANTVTVQVPLRPVATEVQVMIALGNIFFLPAIWSMLFISSFITDFCLFEIFS
jgi:hypothetical protein